MTKFWNAKFFVLLLQEERDAEFLWNCLKKIKYVMLEM